MKKLIFFFLLPLVLFAQGEKQQALELPDFIITGTRGIDVPILQKKKPKLISVLANDFFMPAFSPEDFVPAVLTSPYEKELKIISPYQNYEGKISIGAGRYTLPVGEFNFIKNLSGLILNLNALGSNITQYIPDAGYNNTLLSLGGDYFVNSSSDFLNSTAMSFDLSYFRNSYNMFASPVPSDKRNTNQFNGTVSLSNNAFKYLSYNFSFNAQLFNLNYLSTKETKLGASGSIEYKSQAFNLAAQVSFKNQSIENTIFASDNNSILATDVLLKLKPISGVQTGTGIYVANYNGSTFFMPKANLQMILNDNFTLFAEFSPEIEFLTFSEIISSNRYADFIPAAFQKKKTDFKVSLRYEYGKYFEISGGIGFASYNNFIYFEDDLTAGVFSPKTVDATRIYSFVKLNFHPGPFGYFYGNVILQDMTNDDSKVIPYQPALDANLVYGYDFDMGLSFKAKINYQTSVYSDLLNVSKLPAYQNLAFSISYKIQNSLTVKLDLENLSNNKNYYFKGYLEKPFDIVAGVEYRW
ncbi:MAG: hypothetical protein C0412_14085 [Flavobacterium sp.]|nr:hypothetical protein [Flavobacterium sp.]